MSIPFILVSDDLCYSSLYIVCVVRDKVTALFGNIVSIVVGHSKYGYCHKSWLLR